MTAWVALLRGINVGGRNKVPMADLRALLADLGFEDVATYIQSGNAIFSSSQSAADIAARIETELPRRMALDQDLVRTLVLSASAMSSVVDAAPAGFGADPDTYRYDVLFTFGLGADAVASDLPAHPDVDQLWAGPGVVYFQRLIALASRSRLSKVASLPVYQDLTIRNWRTTTTLRDMVNAL